MKKIILTMLVSMVFGATAFGQYQYATPCQDCDTIPGHNDKYYYGPNGWYDQCDWYQNDGWVDSCLRTRLFLDPVGSIAQWYYTDQPMRVKGLVALVDIYCDHEPFLIPERLPEYMYLFQYDSSSTMIFPGHNRELIKLDSVRWDTIKPYIMKLPEGVSDTSFQYCYAYECYFDKPVWVDSTFYIWGTHYSSAVDTHTLISTYMPTCYLFLRNWEVRRTPGCVYTGPYIQECFPPGRWHTLAYETHRGPRPGFYNLAWPEDMWGLYLPIVDQWNLTGLSSDTLKGEVTGSGRYPDGTIHPLQAIPHAGYVFSHWNDGSTENPRIIHLTQDTVFTAYFDTGAYYNVQTAVNNRGWGTVEGGGTYAVNTVVELAAVPTEGFVFERWDDGDIQNPRTVTVTQDTLFTAVFVLDTSTSGIPEARRLAFGIAPNPTEGTLAVSLEGSEPCTAEVYDATGRCVLREEIAGPRAELDVRRLPAGRYILHLRRGDKSGSLAFVKK